MRERIQKVLAARGIGSRRQVEAWIAAGRVKVNGRDALPGQPIDERDDVRLDGRRLRLGRGTDSPHRAVVYHRPAQQSVRAGADDETAAAVERLPKAGGHRWVPVSPLPARDGGLELFVTDGALAAALTKRGYAIASEFSVRVRGALDAPDLEERLREAVGSSGAKGRVDSVAVAGGEGTNQWLRVAVTGLRPYDLRLALEACGLEANRLMRTRYGPVAMDRAIARGRSRPLSDAELQALQEIAASPATGSRSRPR
jgi:23S rRNA pseudouridine2605 synthase